MVDYNIGDRVKVNYTGVVTEIEKYDHVGAIIIDNGRWVAIKPGAEVEVLERKTFGPGTIIEHKSSGNRYFVTADPNKVFSLNTGQELLTYPELITSEYYNEVKV